MDLTMITALPRKCLTATERSYKFILLSSELLWWRQSWMVQPGPLENCPCSSAVEHSLDKGEVSGSSPDESMAKSIAMTALLVSLYTVEYAIKILAT